MEHSAPRLQMRLVGFVPGWGQKYLAAANREHSQ